MARREQENTQSKLNINDPEQRQGCLTASAPVLEAVGFMAAVGGGAAMGAYPLEGGIMMGTGIATFVIGRIMKR